MKRRLIEEFAQTAAQNPKKIALITEKSQLCFEDVLAMVQVLDIQLRTRGVVDGQTIVLESTRGEFTLAFALLLSLRSFTVIFGGLSQVVEQGIPYDWAIVTEPNDAAPAAKQIVIGPDWFAMMGSLPAPDFSSVSGDGGHFVFRTTGTTGRPKFVKIREARRLQNMSATTQHEAGKYPGMRLLVTSRANTSFAMNWYFPVLLGGGDVVLLSDHLDRVPQYINLYHVTHLVAPPAILKTILETDNPAQYLTSLAEVLVGGASAPQSLLQAFSEICPARIVLVYGATEFGAVCARTFDSKAAYQADYLGEIFRDDLEIAFFDENLEPIPGAIEGNIGLKSTLGATSAYLGDAQLDGQAGFHGDYFLPGDICRREGNALYLVGRVKNIVNLGGEKYALEAIQRHLEAAFAPAEILAVAVHGEDGSDRLVICYRAEDELAADTVNEVLGARFPQPQAARVCRLDAIPLLENGKVDTRSVLEIIAGSDS